MECAGQGLVGRFHLGLPQRWIGGDLGHHGACYPLFLSGIAKIDESLYEAARLDGASKLEEFWHVTVPGVRGEIGVTVTIIAALASFDVVYVMTGGGPGCSTMVPGVQVYQLVVTDNRVGGRQRPGSGP
ncbi:carbohydrate ABC transporter permease [Pseudarthrobacter sp. P1]|uniref:carbohydrate ABC transporter permease n=1 Tax=Pseudarthrobacter sp. P1 TaxID=3418418 RepID=UPI003CF3C532